MHRLEFVGHIVLKASKLFCILRVLIFSWNKNNQRTNGPVNAHLISWPRKAQNIQNLETIW